MKVFTSYDAAVDAAFNGETFTEMKNTGKYFTSNSFIEERGRDERGNRLVSVNVHLSKPIKEVLGDQYDSFSKIIEEYNTCYDGEEEAVVAQWGSYDYFFELIPSAWMADLIGSLDSIKDEPKSIQPVEQMIYSALKSGCAVMDMSDLLIYSL